MELNGDGAIDLIVGSSGGALTQMVHVGYDEATGTPRGAPFERNKLTMGVAYATIVLQGAWFVAAITLGLPLAVVFVHVVVLVFFGVPFGATFFMQKLLGPVEMWWRARFKKGALELVKQDGMKLGG